MNKNRAGIFYLTAVAILLLFLMAGIITCSIHNSDDILVFSENSSELKQDAAKKDIEKLPDITFYDLKLDIDKTNKTYKGSARVDYTNLEDTSLGSLFFRLFPNSGRAYGNGSLEMLAVKADGQDVETLYSLGDSALEVILKEPVKIGDKISIDLDFRGKVPVDFGGGYGIYNYSEDVLCLAGWYPVLAVYDDEGWNIDPSSAIGDSVYSDMAYYNVEIIADGEQKIAATGVLIDSQDTGDGRKKYNYSSGLSRDFFVTLSQDFKLLSRNVQDTLINVYYMKDNKSQAKNTLQIAEDCLKTYNEKFGTYPYLELDLVEVPMNGSIGVEFPGIVIFGSSVFGDKIFTAHEIAHQWWYNIVGNDVYDEPWLDEALTTYSSLIYLEYNQSDAEYQRVLDYFKRQNELNINAGNDDVVTEGLDHFEELGGKHYSLIVYVKGALFYHAVRQKIGDDAFFDALKNYYSDKKYQIASTGDILQKLEQSSGQELDDIYNEWLY